MKRNSSLFQSESEKPQLATREVNTRLVKKRVMDADN